MNIRPFSAILLSRRREIGKGAEVEADGVAKRCSDRDFKQPGFKQPTDHVLAARGARAVRVVPPRPMRGSGAPKGAGAAFVAWRRCRARATTPRASPFGAPPRLFCSRDRASGYGRQDNPPAATVPHPAGFRPPYPHPSNRHSGRASVVGPDGYPRPPESVGASHVRRRRLPPHFKNASRSAPHGRDREDYNQEWDIVKARIGKISGSGAWFFTRPWRGRAIACSRAYRRGKCRPRQRV
ncbi:hypothetical protein V1281_001390 [Nitrobacteraceae bacterium AZCC 2161]